MDRGGAVLGALTRGGDGQHGDEQAREEHDGRGGEGHGVAVGQGVGRAVNLYVGDVQGVNPSDPKGVLGLYPVAQNGTQG